MIFDEASQIEPAAALPAIARARQVVVAGDSLQPPPTTLFKRTVVGVDSEELDDEDKEDGSTTGIVVKDMESILDAVETKLGSQRSRHLAWHYRSRDERLIATSNTWVYRPVGRQMTTFPATDGAAALCHVTVPPSTGLGSTNLSPVGELNAVIDLVLEHARAQVDGGAERQSLGVISYGRKHGERLVTELESRLPAETADVRAFFDPAAHEPFFIKNIERVQGDEREDHHQRRVHPWQRRQAGLPLGPHQRFRRPPARRNVAISRAREELVLVTSFESADVDERASAAEGFQSICGGSSRSRPPLGRTSETSARRPWR